MDATVTLKVNPREFDLVREAVEDSRDRATEQSDNPERSAPERRADRQRAVELTGILEKLK